MRVWFLRTDIHGHPEPTAIRALTYVPATGELVSFSGDAQASLYRVRAVVHLVHETRSETDIKVYCQAEALSDDELGGGAQGA